MGFGSDVYTGVATYGRIRATIGAIVGVLIALMLIIIGIVLLQNRHTAEALVTVTAVRSCGNSMSTSNGVPVVNCSVSVAFTTDAGVAVTASGVNVSGTAAVAVGDTMYLRYDPKNPKDVRQTVSPRLAGWLCIGGGLLVGGGSVLNAYFTMKSKTYAAVDGSLALAGDLRRVL